MIDYPYKPTLCIEFDGVIHSYERGWQGGVIYGTVTPDFFEWCLRAQDMFKLSVYSSRSSKDLDRTAMMKWLEKQLEDWNIVQPFDKRLLPGIFDFPRHKPPAWITIDDRCVRFDGSWDVVELQPDELLAFKPWNVKDLTQP